MSREERVHDARTWLRYAEADLAFAEAPLPSKGLYEILAFHAQQTAEKALKAILVLHGIDFPKTHNLEFLLTLLPESLTPAPVTVSLYRLTGYATIARYPGEEEPLSEQECRDLLAIARETLTWATAVVNAAG